jgi:large subunit ribosomal protein L14
MIQTLSRLKIIDNTGGFKAKVIRILEGNKRESANLGAYLVTAIKAHSSHSKVKKGEIYRFRLLRTKKMIHRLEGIQITFDKHGGILLNKQLLPLGSRVFGPVAKELIRKYKKINYMCKKIL